jgi:hypothetical protein
MARQSIAVLFLFALSLDCTRERPHPNEAHPPELEPLRSLKPNEVEAFRQAEQEAAVREMDAIEREHRVERERTAQEAAYWRRAKARRARRVSPQPHDASSPR